MWMPPQTTTPPSSGGSAAGRGAPTGAKRMRRVQLFGRALVRRRPTAAQTQGEPLRLRVAGPREREHRAPWMPRDLRDDVGSRAESIDPSSSGSPAIRSERKPISPAHSSGAASASENAPGNAEAESRVGHDELGIAAVDACSR